MLAGDVYVTDFFARARPGVGTDFIEGFNDGKEGRIGLIDATTDVFLQEIPIAPLPDTGFTADRADFDSATGAFNDTFKAPWARCRRRCPRARSSIS